MRRVLTSMGVIALAVSTLAACGDDDDGGGADTTSGGTEAPEGPAATDPASVPANTGGTGGTGEDATLTIAGFEFPAELTAAAGTPIALVNDDDAEHSVTADDEESFDVDVEGGESGELVVDEPGTYAYHCKYHDSMHGTLIIE